MIYNFIDERKIIEELLKDKTTINKNPMQKLIVYIKYLKSEGKNKPAIRIMIEELMEEYYIGFCVPPCAMGADLQSKKQKQTQKTTFPDLFCH